MSPTTTLAPNSYRPIEDIADEFLAKAKLFPSSAYYPTDESYVIVLDNRKELKFSYSDGDNDIQQGARGAHRIARRLYEFEGEVAGIKRVLRAYLVRINNGKLFPSRLDDDPDLWFVGAAHHVKEKKQDQRNVFIDSSHPNDNGRTN